MINPVKSGASTLFFAFFAVLSTNVFFLQALSGNPFLNNNLTGAIFARQRTLNFREKVVVFAFLSRV